MCGVGGCDVFEQMCLCSSSEQFVRSTPPSAMIRIMIFLMALAVYTAAVPLETQAKVLAVLMAIHAFLKWILR